MGDLKVMSVKRGMWGNPCFICFVFVMESDLIVRFGGVTELV